MKIDNHPNERRRQSACVVVCAATLAICSAKVSIAQSRPSFEVASVKMRPDVTGPRTTNMAEEPGRLNYTDVGLRACILAAYGLKDYQLEGMEHRSPERYDIVAKADHPATGKDLMALLQLLLEERFRLKFHTDSREIPVYKITAGNGTSRLREARTNGGSDFTGGPNPRLRSQGITIQRLADFLSGFTDLPVIDQSGRPGFFEFTLEWKVSSNQADTADEIFAAVERELGLKVERSKASVQIMVVDRLETVPTAN